MLIIDWSSDVCSSDLRTRSYASYCLNQSGKREWSVLLQIGAKQLSPRAAKRLAELERKFHGQKPEQPDGIRGGMVRSPIAGERTKFMNDDAWLNAIRKFSRPREEMRWRGDGLTGGAMELSRELKERSEARSVGKEGVRTCRSWWSQFQENKK